jgi:hypothetical protein
MSLETMGQDGKLPAPGPRPIEVEKIIVRREYPLALINNAVDRAGYRGIKGLEVAVVEQERSSVGGLLDYGHRLLMKIMYSFCQLPLIT